MFGGLFDETVDLIKRWKPKKRYKKEIEYRDDLMKFLFENLNKSRSGFFGATEEVIVKKEANRSFADIAVGDYQIGIELKKDLKRKSDVDRLFGQMDHYIKEYKEGIIVVLVGDVNDMLVPEIKRRLKEKVESLTGFYRLGWDVINKSKGSNRKRVREESPLFGSLLPSDRINGPRFF